MRVGWSAVAAGLMAVGAIFACSSSSPLAARSPGVAGTTGTGGTHTGRGGASGSVGDTGGIGGMSGTGGTYAGRGGTSESVGGMGGTAGLGGAGGKGGTGGMGGACNPGIAGSPGSYVCGPAPVCDGNAIAILAYCDTVACSGPVTVRQRKPCPDGTVCGGGKCLTHATPPEKACSVVTDCGLPPTVCVGANEQLIFSDPTCDDGKCHWTQIVDTCGSTFGTTFYCNGGTCYDPGMQTRGPITPTPTPDAMQPPPAPAQACTTTADCAQPPPTCFNDSVVSYVHGVCRAGACDWDIDLNECAGTCGDGGVCVAP